MFHLLKKTAQGIAIFCACLSITIAEGRPASPVVIDIAQFRELAPTSLYSGLVLSKNDIQVPAELAGRLISVAEIGSQLKKGEVIARLDDTFLQQQRAEELATIKSEEARLDLHTKEVQRYQRLIKKNNVAEIELDQSILDQALARSNISAAQARLAQIDERLRRSVIRAPFSGIISEKFLNAGEWSENGTAVVRIVDTQNLEVQLNVPQSIVSLLSLGNTLSVIHQGEMIPATLSTIVPVSSNNSRLFELRLTPREALSPGALVRVSVPNAQAKNVVAIHRDALVLRKGSMTVFRVNAEKMAEQIAVKVGIGDGDYIEVIGDIAAGDQVIIRGGERLRPGMMVNIKDQAES